MITSHMINADRALLDLARDVFAEQNYSIEELEAEGVKFLLAENAYFLVGVVATPTIAQLLVAEATVEAAITNQMARSDIGAKRWDAYLIMLTQERALESPEVTRGLFEINYDTSRLRRIAHANVRPTERAVRSTLSPFVTPSEVEDPLITENPLQVIIEVLEANGVDRQLAQRAVDAFEQGVPLGNVL